jgi:nucleotide-binding universal stress UspA family protein
MYKKIMVPLDGSKLAECVMPHIEKVIKDKGASEVVLVQAVEPVVIPYGREVAEIKSMEQLEAYEVHNRVAAEKYLKGVVEQLTKAGIKARAEIISGKAADELIKYAGKQQFDLIVIASHGRSGISRMVWGSVAERLFHHVNVPVLIIRAPGCGISV